MHAQSRRIGLAALVTALATLLVIGLLAYRDWRQFQAAIVSRNEASRAIALNQRLLGLVGDAETGQRGYLLTGRTEYLAPYQAAIEQIPPQLNELKQLEAGRSARLARLQRLDELIKEKLDELGRTIELRRSQNLAGALAIVETDEGKQTMDRIRRISGELDSEDNAQWATDWQELQANAQRVRVVSVIGAVLMAILVAVGGVTLRSSAAEMERLIADLKVARKTAERNADLLKVTLYSIGDGVITADRHGAVQMMNSTAEKLTGYSEHEAKGQQIEKVFHIVNESTREMVESPVRRVLREGVVVGLANHTVLVSKSGADVPIDDSGAPITQKDGAVTGVVLVFRDVSERKRARETEQRMALIVENSDDAIIGKTLEGIVTSWNRGAERLFGYTSEEMVGQPIARLMPPDRPDDMKAILERIRRGETVEHYETVRMTKSGERLAVSLTVSAIRDDKGRVMGASKIARDITQEKQLEGTLRQAQKMEAVGRLAGGIAHDFNNLLTVILGYAATLEAKLDAQDPLRRTTVEIRRAGEQAAALVGQLLAFGRKQMTQLRVVDLGALLLGMKDMIERVAGEDVDVAIVPESGPSQVKADPGQLSQVLVNLAINARDAMPRGGKLTIETKQIFRDQEVAGKHGVRPAGNYVVLAVTDNGEGMDEETQSHIFEPFFTTKGVGKGAGLGLSSVYGIVQQHGGWIEVYSEIGHGTTFRIYFPQVASPESSPAPGSPVRQARKVRSGTILLVEDQAAIRMLVEDVLFEAGYQVLAAGTGPAALKLAEEHKGAISVLVTDVVMPEMSGPDLAAALTRAQPDLLVLYISGYTDHALLHRGVIAEGSAFLQKPFRPEALLTKIDELLA